MAAMYLLLGGSCPKGVRLGLHCSIAGCRLGSSGWYCPKVQLLLGGPGTALPVRCCTHHHRLSDKRGNVLWPTAGWEAHQAVRR